MNAIAPIAGIRVRRADVSNPSEVARAEAFVLVHPAAELFHRPQWIAAAEQGCRQTAHLLVAEDASGTLMGLLPLSEVRSPLFGSAMVSTGFGVGGGILAGNDPAETLLAEAAAALATERGCGSIELRGGPIPAGFEARTGTYASFARDLPADEESILKAIPRKQRAEVRKAQGQGLTISIGSGESDLAAHFTVYAESVRNLGTPVFPPALFKAMVQAFGADCDILTVRKADRAVASVLSFYFKGTVYPYWGGGTREARGLRANELLYFELMRHAASRGCTRFDFGRSKLGTGAYAYKKNWGFEPAPLTYGVRSLAGSAPREINPLDPKYRLQIAVWKRLPLWLANRLGPIIARGLG